MKKLLKVLVVLLLLLVLVAVAGYVFLDQAVEAAVEKGGTYAMGVETELGSADVGLFSGHFGLESLTVANPAGFSQPSFLTLAKGEMDVELDSLNKDPLVVPRLLIDGMTLSLARNDSGTNYGVILDNLKRFESGKQPGAPPSKEEGRKVLIHEIVIRGVDVSVDPGTSVAGLKPVSFTIPEIHIEEVGTGGEGRSISEQFSIILDEVLSEVMKRGQGMIPPELMQDLQNKLGQIESLPGQLGEDAQKKVDEAVEDAKKSLDDQTKQIEKGAQDKLKELGGGAQDLLKKKSGGK